MCPSTTGLRERPRCLTAVSLPSSSYRPPLPTTLPATATRRCQACADGQHGQTLLASKAALEASLTPVILCLTSREPAAMVPPHLLPLRRSSSRRSAPSGYLPARALLSAAQAREGAPAVAAVAAAAAAAIVAVAAAEAAWGELSTLMPRGVPQMDNGRPRGYPPQLPTPAAAYRRRAPRPSRPPHGSTEKTPGGGAGLQNPFFR